MVEDLAAPCPSQRAIEQAIMALKKGAHLLKCGSNGKTKFCSFRLSMDEKFLIWCSGQEEKQLKLSSVIDITRGQCAKQVQAEKESQSFSLVYANGERYLHVICKDKRQADSWHLGLQVILSRSQHQWASGILKQRGTQSCVSSPASYLWRKHMFGLSSAKSSKVLSINGSPTQSLSERCFSDGLSCSSGSLYSESSLSSKHYVVHSLSSGSTTEEPHFLNQKERFCANIKGEMQCLRQPPASNKSDAVVLRDLLIWGEGAERGFACWESPCDALLPKLLDSALMLDIASISLGGKHAAVVTKQGEIFCWGEGKKGRLGLKLDIDATSPRIVDSLSGVCVKSVTCGEYQTCALTDSGELYMWGESGCDADIVVPNGSQSHWLPRKLSGPLSGLSVLHVACGEWHTAIVSTTGQLYTFGDGTFGVLGHGNLQSTSHPKEVESLRGLRVISVACGLWHTAAVVDLSKQHSKTGDRVGKLFTWGDGDEGKLGHSDQERKLIPKCVERLVDHDFVQVCCGRMITVGLTNMGKIYTMGSTVHGQLGDPHAKDKSVTLVQGKLRDERVTEISVGSYHIAALTAKGLAYTWGKGANGQLGVGDTKDRNSPTLVEALRDRKVEHITCGPSSTASICLHKSIFTADQSTCSGCATGFGFTRKKHNCYHCGLLFCRSCCGHKATNASLAPNKVSPFRVCGQCFRKLERMADSSTGRIGTPRPLSMSEKIMPDERYDKGERSTGWSRMKLSKSFSNESREVQNKQLDSVSAFCDGLQRWGQVSCPEVFKINGEGQIPMSSDASLRNVFSPSPCRSEFSFPPKSNITAVPEEKEVSRSRKYLAEEVQKLQSQVEDLKKLCKTRKEKIQEYKQKTEEAWSLAKDEATKSKAAKELIRVLATRIHALSDSFSDRRDGGYQAGVDLDHVASTNTDNPYLGNFEIGADLELIENRNIGSPSSSPLIISNASKDFHGQSYNGETESVLKSCDIKAGNKSLKHEWTEQYQPGVYITCSMLSNGQRSLMRVRFSRRKFTETEAKRWWHENQELVHEKYDMDEHTTPYNTKMI